MNEFAQAISDVEKKYSMLLASPKYRMGDLPKRYAFGRDIPFIRIWQSLVCRPVK